MRRLAVAAMIGLASSALAQGAQPDAVTFAFVPPGPAFREFSLELGQDGRGELRYKGADAAHPVRVGQATMLVLDKAYAAVAAKHCETSQKHIAQTGQKTLTYAVGSTVSSCTFNYSDEADVNAAASAFLAIQQTVQIGAELARLHRFDRLGLDAEMDALEKAIEGGFAIEVGNIAPVLQSLVDDDRVMERVRRRAARLLEGMPRQG